MSEQIRKLENYAVISGKLMELEVTEKADKNGKDYIRLKGLIQFGPNALYQKRFGAYAARQKKDGTDNKVYTSIQQWASTAVPASKGGNDYVSIVGELDENNYVNASGTFIEALQIQGRFFNEYTEDKCAYDIECVLLSFADEVVNDTVTGRGIASVCTMNSYGRPVVLKKVIVPEEYVNFFQYDLKKGSSLKLNIDVMPNTRAEAVQPVSNGFGQARSLTSGKSWLEDVVIGGSEPYEDGDARKIDPDAIKLALVERNNINKEIKEKGYQGGKSTMPSSAGRRATSPLTSQARTQSASSTTVQSPTAAPKMSKVESNDDDDFPF